LDVPETFASEIKLDGRSDKLRCSVHSLKSYVNCKVAFAFLAAIPLNIAALFVVAYSLSYYLFRLASRAFAEGYWRNYNLARDLLS
jgi:hypothetical protein